MTTKKDLLKRLQKIEATIKELNAEKAAIYRKARVKEISIEELKADLYSESTT